MKVLDLFCGAGGASMGYHRAGADVVGVDLANETRYPFTFHRADALAVLRGEVPEIDPASFDLIHASPPCQVYTRAKHLREAQGKTTSKADLLAPTRDLLREIGVPYVIENVVGAPMDANVMLCGSMFGLKVRRHRLFEATFTIPQPACDHRGQGRPVGVYHRMGDQVKGISSKTGKVVYGGRTASSLEEAQEAMGIDWMLWGDLVESIPPAYTQHIGHAFILDAYLASGWPVVISA